MQVPTFLLERNQTLYENVAEINLTESGVHPVSISNLLDAPARERLMSMPLGYGYTEGLPTLRSAIADWHPGAGPDNVLVAHGSSEAGLVTLMALCDAGDEIVIVVPNFMQLDGLAQGLGVTVRQVELRPEQGWQPDLDRIAAAIGPKTRLVTICDPNNPTGVAMTPESRRGLAALTEAKDVWLLVDEIYRGSEIGGGDSPTAWGLGDKVIVIGGLAKSFGLSGLRLGWLIAPAGLVDEAHRRQDYTTIGTGPIAQVLAEAALTEPMRSRLLARGRKILAEGRDTVADWVRRHNGWSWVEPGAGGMAFLDYARDPHLKDYADNSPALVAALRDATGVFVCAGAWFGLEGHIRISLGVDPHHLREGLDRIDAFVAAQG